MSTPTGTNITFSTNRYKDAIYPVDLQEHWLRLVENGPSMAMWALDSPMLELAHERRFVISQQGGNSADFEREHVDRIKLCMIVLSQTFHDGAGWKLHDVHDPPAVDHTGLWVGDQLLDVPIDLELLEDEPMVDVFEPTFDRDDRLSVPSASESLQHPMTPLSPLSIRIGDGTTHRMNQESENSMDYPVIRFARATGTSRTMQAQPVRALKPVRLRRRMGDQKKQTLSNGIQKTNHIHLLPNKSCLYRAEHTRSALLLASAKSLSTPPASSPDDSDYDKLYA